MLIIEFGAIANKSDSYITVADFEQFLLKFGFEVLDDKEVLLRKAFVFMQSLSWIASHREPYSVDDNFIIAQCYLAASVDSGSLGFDFNEFNAPKILTRKGIGSGAIAKTWEVNNETMGSDSLSILKRLPFVFNLLSPFLRLGSQKMLRA